jgi:hypothetical protein
MKPQPKSKKEQEWQLGRADGIQDRLDGEESKHPNDQPGLDAWVNMEEDAHYWNGYGVGYWKDNKKGWKS